MNKTITRDRAVAMFTALEKMTLGQMDTELLKTTLTNINELRKVSEDFEALKKELFKRIYGDVNGMEEAERKRLQEFFDMLGKIGARKTSESEAMEAACKEVFPELYEKRVKEVAIQQSLLLKEIDVELVEVDETDFTAEILKANPKAKAEQVHDIFEPLFAVSQKKESDYSELDELLK